MMGSRLAAAGGSSGAGTLGRHRAA